EGMYAVPGDSAIGGVDDVDRPGVRIGAKLGSAYDLHLTRHLRRAEVVRGDEGTEAFERHGLEVAAGIRQPLAEYVAAHPGMRLLEPAFMEIRQAMAVSAERSAAVQEYVREFVEARKADGAVVAALARAGQDPALAAPAA
ncbi:MAG: ABC transporter substrate-binding protein, partial [Microbacteriaceae bacterium]|nr:ABC transporter substrate-binding protein [Microbacteriaceae bacterium]